MELNRIRLLDGLRRYGPATFDDLADRLKMPRRGVYRQLEEMLRAGMVTEAGVDVYAITDTGCRELDALGKGPPAAEGWRQGELFGGSVDRPAREW